MPLDSYSVGIDPGGSKLRGGSQDGQMQARLEMRTAIPDGSSWVAVS